MVTKKKVDKEKPVRKPKNDRDLNKYYECYDCGNKIANLKDMVEKKVVLSVGKDELITRTFHLNCLLSFQERALDMEFLDKEDSDWDKAYQYFKKEYLKLDDWKEMQGHAVSRLRGLRIGKYYPNGRNVKILKRGYSYDTIYKAMVMARPIAMAKASGVNFADMKHKIDFFMKFITSQIEDVQLRIDKLNKANKATEKASKVNKNVVVEDHAKSYAEMLKQQEKDNKNDDIDKALSVIDGIWGVVLDDEDE